MQMNKNTQINEKTRMFLYGGGVCAIPQQPNDVEPVSALQMSSGSNQRATTKRVTVLEPQITISSS